MSPAFSISLLGLIFAGFCTFETLAHQAAIPLITVKKNNENSEKRFVLNPDAISMIKQLSSPVKVIAAIGDARVGKSTALNFIHYTLSNVGNSAFHTKKAQEIFPTGNTMEAVTHGVWISIINGTEHEMDNVILLDVEGTDLGDDSVTDKLSIFTALTSSTLMLFMKESPSTHILDFLYKIVRLSELAFGNKTSSHFPHLLAVLRGALRVPKGYSDMEAYIIDALIEPKWKDQSNKKREAIGKRFLKENITVFNLPYVNIDYFEDFYRGNLAGLSNSDYLNQIETLSSNLMKLPEKKTLNGAVMKGQNIADIVEELVKVMNNKTLWKGLNPAFYFHFEEDVCNKSYKELIEPLTEQTAEYILNHKDEEMKLLKERCAIEWWITFAEKKIEKVLGNRASNNWDLFTIKSAGTFTAGFVLRHLMTWMSDIKLKENITILDDSKYETIGLRGVEWVWNKEAERLGLSGRGSGVVAQDVELLYPWAVTEGYDGYKRVNYFALRLLIYAQKFQSLESPVYKRYVETC